MLQWVSRHAPAGTVYETVASPNWACQKPRTHWDPGPGAAPPSCTGAAAVMLPAEARATAKTQTNATIARTPPRPIEMDRLMVFPFLNGPGSPLTQKPRRRGLAWASSGRAVALASCHSHRAAGAPARPSRSPCSRKTRSLRSTRAESSTPAVAFRRGRRSSEPAVRISTRETIFRGQHKHSFYQDNQANDCYQGHDRQKNPPKHRFPSHQVSQYFSPHCAAVAIGEESRI
jgi:hypothetical protein